MSGGSLGDYDYYKLSYFLDDLEKAILRAEGKQRGDDSNSWVISENPNVIDSLKYTLQLGKEFVRLAKAADWLAAGDYGDDTYLKEVRGIALDTLAQKEHQYG